MFFSRQTRYGLAVRGTAKSSTGKSRSLTCCVRFASELPGLPQLLAGMQDLLRKRKFVRSLVSEFHPESKPRLADLPHIFAVHALAVELHNFGLRMSSREPTGALLATTLPAVDDE